MFSVIIPSKSIDNLVPCVEAVRRCEPDARIIVIWDASKSDVIPTTLHSCEMHVAYEEFVFSRNINLGIRAAGSDDVICLNDDALLETPGGFSALIAQANEHQEFGIIASTCNNVGNRNQWPTGVGHLREEVRMVCFVCVLIPRRTINSVGLMDEDLTGYGLDDDSYSLRVRRAGLKIGVSEDCYVDHGRLRSTYRGDPSAPADFRPNLKIFIQKYGVDNRGETKETSQFPECFPS